MMVLLTLLGAFLLGIIVTLAVANFGPGEKRIDRELDRLYTVADPQFRRALSVLLGPPFVEGNAVKTLLNGDAIFAAMLKDIGTARKSVNFETYIYWDGSIGKEFATALSERARAGVKVHVLLDWIGSAKLDAQELETMKSAGVEVERYHQPHWSHLARLNNRTHRKLLVIDGDLGFTGGVGIADKWRGNAEDTNHWRDTHFRVVGPVVAQMQAVFNDNWVKATSRVLHGDLYFPALQEVAGVPAQMFSSSPSGGAESMHLMYLLAITSAAESIDLESAYFVPDQLTVDALVAAAGRGVRVRIITPGPDIDSSIVRTVSHELWGPLLRAGVSIAEYQPTMFHCKVLVVDGLFTSVGSTNFDNRSFRLNDEANLNIVDAGFAKEQVATFNADLARSRPITFDAWQKRPLREKIWERVAALSRAQI
ncbi:MAG: cardiolipin synthase [Casimicrobiaceae bacterium]